jgi:glycosyltransferase involved in cell wall biosynthesis
VRFFFAVGTWFWNANVVYAASLARELQESGHRVIFSARLDGKPYTNAQALGLSVSPLDYDTQNPFRLLAQFWRLYRQLRNFTPDWLVAVNSKAQFILVLYKILLNRRQRIVRILADVRSPSSGALNRWFYSRWLDAIVTSADVLSEKIDDRLTIPGHRVKRIYMGYPVSTYMRKFDKSAICKEYSLPQDKKILLHIGRLAGEKDHDTLIAAANRFLPARRDLHLLISGAEQQYTFADLSEKLSPDLRTRVTFLPRVDDVRKLLSVGSVGIITSRSSEVICRVAVEYMLYGLPVIASNINVIPEMIGDGVNGFIVPCCDAEALSKKILQLFADEIGYKNMAKANQRKASSEYDVKKMTSQFLNFLELIGRNNVR